MSNTRKMNIIFQLLILCHGFVLYTLSCIESKGTVKYVEYCPRNRGEWFQASRRKNCSSIKHSCGTLVYHCVINPCADALLEVCAPRRNILDQMCAEYNIGGGLVQENQLVNCKNHTVPCEFGYSSDEAYKYQDCYNLVYSKKPSLDILSTKMPTNAEKYSSTSNPRFWERCEEDRSSATALGICLGVAIIVCVIQTAWFIFCWRKKNKQIALLKEQRTKRTCNYKPEDVVLEEETCLALLKQQRTKRTCNYKPEDVVLEEETTCLDDRDDGEKYLTGSDKSEPAKERKPGKDDGDKDFENLTAAEKAEGGKEKKTELDPKKEIKGTKSEMNNRKMVAAIEIGPHYCCFANATETEAKTATINNPISEMTSKFLTALLWKDKKKDSTVFGFEAREKYTTLQKAEQSSYHYIPNFEKLTVENGKCYIKDEKGRCFEALGVFKKFIKCIVQVLHYEIDRGKLKVENSEMYFVFTIPSCWKKEHNIESIIQQAANDMVFLTEKKHIECLSD